ncbi:MAG TPA: VOC family protein [Acidimicrobiales bacterium]|nr:VOC family protein [Acidimicrobiales bacterium]
MTVVNHVGLAVSDLERSRRFYEEVLGFEFKNEITVPDGPTTKMFALAPPVGLRVAYLQKDGWVLELLAFDDAGVTDRAARPINEPGLTHISVSVDDIDEVESQAAAFGGEVLSDREIKGMVSMIRDPDGQLIELLPMSYRRTL